MKTTLPLLFVCLCLVTPFLAEAKCSVISRQSISSLDGEKHKVSLIYHTNINNKSQVSRCVGSVNVSELCDSSQVPHNAEIVVYSILDEWKNKRFVRKGSCIESLENRSYQNGQFLPQIKFEMDGHWKLIERLE
jgi:hypothetical protein